VTRRLQLREVIGSGSYLLPSTTVCHSSMYLSHPPQSIGEILIDKSRLYRSYYYNWISPTQSPIRPSVHWKPRHLMQCHFSIGPTLCTGSLLNNVTSCHPLSCSDRGVLFSISQCLRHGHISLQCLPFLLLSLYHICC
jgi:hypothetical protein